MGYLTTLSTATIKKEPVLHEWVWINGRMIPTGENQSTNRKTCLSANLSTTKPNKDWNGIESGAPKWETGIACIIAQPYVSPTESRSSCYNLCRLRDSSQLCYIRRKASMGLNVALTRLCEIKSLPNLVTYISRRQYIAFRSPWFIKLATLNGNAKRSKTSSSVRRIEILVIVQSSSYSRIYTHI